MRKWEIKIIITIIMLTRSLERIFNPILFFNLIRKGIISSENREIQVHEWNEKKKTCLTMLTCSPKRIYNYSHEIRCCWQKWPLMIHIKYTRWRRMATTTVLDPTPPIPHAPRQYVRQGERFTENCEPKIAFVKDYLNC